VTHSFGLNDVAKAVDMARQQECVKAVVVP
jgi:hypothetical protein